MPLNNVGQPLDLVTLAQLRAFVQRYGETKAWRLLTISPSTGARGLAGLGLSRGSHVMIRQGLDAADKAKAA